MFFDYTLTPNPLIMYLALQTTATELLPAKASPTNFPITFGPKGRNYADAAIAKVTINEYLVGEVLGSDDQSTYSISGVTEVSVGDTVRKLGRTPASPSARWST
jgi:hypothetical protein